MIDIMILFIAIANLFACSVAASSTDSALVGDDELCNPSGTAFRYTGIRLYQTTLYDWPVRHFYYLLRCNSGQKAAQQYFVANRTENFKFGEEVCISEEECYALSRFKEYSERKVPLFRPHKEIGAIYKISHQSNETYPLYSLVSDNMADSVSLRNSFGTRMKYTPILSSPEYESGPQWASQLATNPLENYTFADSDKHSSWHMKNSLINRMSDALTVNNKDLVFWEFDALQKQLDGNDWRKIANQVVPDI